MSSLQRRAPALLKPETRCCPFFSPRRLHNRTERTMWPASHDCSRSILPFRGPAMLRPRRRGMASVNAEVRDGIVPAAGALAKTHDEGPETSGINYRIVALIIACALLMENLDATVLATALPTMARDFGLRAPQLSIALTSYLLALAVFIPASGFVADRYGSRPVFQAAIVL